MNPDLGLRRFVSAQDAGGTFDTALAELRRGSKRSHWMWFVFPQLAGLGRSATSEHYALADLEEARAYLAHPVLGARLIACAAGLADREGHDPVAILGGVDAMKLRSSMTLFARAASDEPVFADVLDRYFGGEQDPATLALL